MDKGQSIIDKIKAEVSVECEKRLSERKEATIVFYANMIATGYTGSLGVYRCGDAELRIDSPQPIDLNKLAVKEVNLSVYIYGKKSLEFKSRIRNIEETFEEICREYFENAVTDLVIDRVLMTMPYARVVEVKGAYFIQVKPKWFTDTTLFDWVEREEFKPIPIPTLWQRIRYWNWAEVQPRDLQAIKRCEELDEYLAYRNRNEKGIIK